MRFIQGLAMFAAVLAAGAVTAALVWTVAVLVTPPDDTAKQMGWQAIVFFGGGVILVATIAVWLVLMALAGLKRLGPRSAIVTGLGIGVALALALTALAADWSGIWLVLLWMVPFPLAGALAGWWVWRRMLPAEGVF